LPVALPEDVQVKVVVAAGPLDCDCDRACMGLPESAGYVDVEVEVVADKIRGVNGSGALGGVRGESERVEMSLPRGAWLSVRDRAS